MKWYPAYIFLLLILTSCAKKEQPVTKAEAVAYSEKIKALIKNRDAEIFNKILNDELFAGEVVKAAGEEGSRSLKEQVKKTLHNRNLSNELYSSIGKDGLYEFLKQYEKNGHQHLIFRLYGNGGLNYHDYELVKYDDKISAKDLYIYLTGENLSRTMAQMYSATLKQTNGSNTLAGQYSKNLSKLKSLYSKKEFAAAKAIFDKLPSALKKEKTFQLINLQITSEMDNETYTEALKEFEDLFKNDASAQLPLFDYYFLRADYKKSLQVINQIDTTVQDPLLDYYRGLIYTQMKEDKTAVVYLEKLYKNMPYFETGVLELMANYIEMQRYNETNALIASYKKNRSFNQARLSDMQDHYPDVAANVNW